MSTTIDQKVVEMRFDNRHFEQHTRESMSTLEKLKQKLNLSGASKGLENLNTSANKVNMNGLSSALDTVHSKFSAMEIIGATALANITNSAVNAGKRIVSALTIDPVKDGFNEYEMTLNAVQTTMAGTGKTAKEVEQELKKLDEYADKTVYSTADMLNNLPKFTNAGVELQDATKAMIGIANATALAGGDAGKASIAFYNLGQAIGTGYLTRMDYNSINNAGIATMEWKNQMVDAAIAAGTLKKVGEDSYKAGNKTLTLQQLFIDGLQEQWATTEVMMKVFGDYGDETTEIGKKSYSAAQDIKTFSMMMDSLKATAGTGWKDTWQIIFGGLDEAKEFWTGLTNFISGIITGMADFRNKILDSALGRSFGGLLDNIKKPFKEIEKTVNNVKDYAKVVDEIINGKWGNGKKRWDALTKAGYDWKHAQNLVNEELGVSLRRTTSYKEAQKETVKTQEKVNEATTDYLIDLIALSDAQLKAKGYTDEQIKAFREIEKVSKQTGIPLKEFIDNIDEIDGRWILINSFKNAGQGLVAVFKAMKDAWLDIFPVSGVADGLFNMIAGFHKFTTYLKVSEEAADKLKRTFKGVFAILDIVLTIIGGPIKIAFKIFLQFLSALDIGFDGVLSFTAGVGDAIVAVHDWLDSVLDFTGVFKFLAPYIKDAAKAVGNWFKSLKDSKLIKKLTDYLKDSKEAIIEWFKGLKEADNIPKYIIQGLANGLKSGVSAIVNIMLDFGQKILDAICKVLGIHSPSTKFFEIGKNIIQGLFNGLQNGASIIFEFIKGLGSKCVELFNKIDFGKLLAAGIGIGMIVTITKLLDVINNFTAPLEGFGSMMDSIGDGFEAIGKGIKTKLVSEAMKNMAISIAILAASILILSRIDAGTLWATIGAIAALAAIIGVLAFAASKMNDLGDFGKSSLSILGITASLFIVAMAMKKLASIDPERMGSVIAGFTAMIIGLGILLVVIGKAIDVKAAKNIDKVGKMISKIAFALLLMVGVIKLTSMLKGSEIGKGVAVISMLGLLIAGIIAVSTLAGKTGDKTGKMISKIAFALLVMVGVIKLASMLEGEEIAKGILVISMVGVFFAGLIAVSKFAGKHAAKAGGMMLMMSVALAITVSVIKQASKLRKNELIKAMPVIGALSVFFAGLIAVSKFAGKEAIKAGTMLLMISAALVILTGVLFILSKLDGKGLYKALGVVAVLEALFGGLMFVSKYAKQSIGTLVVLTVAITLLVAAVIGLTFIDSKKLSIATANISAMIGALSLLIASTKLMKTSKNMIKTVLPLIAVIGLMAGIVMAMSKINPQNSIASATALSMLLLSFSASLAIMSVLGPVATSGIGAMAALIGVIAALATILGVMDHLNVEGSMTTVKALSTLLIVMTGVLAALSLIGLMGTTAYIGVGAIAALALVVAGLATILKTMDGMNVEKALVAVRGLSELLMAMSAALVILSVVGLAGPAAFVGIAALIALIAGIAGVVVALGALNNKFPEFEKFLTKGLPLLEKIGYGLGAFVGNIVGGFLAGTTSGLPAIATNLSMFMTNLGPFLDGARNIDETVVDGISALTKAILMITGADLLQTISSWITGESSLTTFGTELASLGTYMAIFTKNLGTFTETQVTSVDCASKAILALAQAADQIPGQGGLWDDIFGAKSISEFGNKLPGLGTNLRNFVTNIGTFTDAQVTTVSCAGKAILALAEAADKIPNEGGWAAEILGDNSISTFGDKLPGLGSNLRNFVINLGTFSDAQVSTVNSAGKAIVALAEASDKIPNTGGLWSWLAGDNDIEDFAKKLPIVGTCLKEFTTNLGTFEDAQSITIDCAADALVSLADAAEKIPDTGGLFSLFTGDNDIEDFGKKLPKVGSCLKDFASNLGTFNEDKVATVNAACDALNAVAKLGSIDLSSVGDKLPNFGDRLNTFAAKIKTFAAKLSEVSSDSIREATSKVKQLVQMIGGIAETNYSSVKSFSDSLNTLGKAGVDSFIKAFQGEGLQRVKDAAGKMMVGCVNGAEDKKPTMIERFKAIVRGCVNGMCAKEFKDTATQAGKDIGSGLVNGINAKQTAVYNAGYALGQKAVQGEKDGQKSNSPSKLTHQAGIWLGEGLVNGMVEMGRKVYNAGHDLGDEATRSMSSTISKIASAINSDIDDQPTIRPVLDLSDVESGAGYLNTMFNNPSIGVMSNLNAISRGMNAKNQNGTTSDVVSAINKLRKDLGNVGGTTNNYNVNGVTYDDGSNITDAVRTIVRAAKMERRV